MHLISITNFKFNNQNESSMNRHPNFSQNTLIYMRIYVPTPYLIGSLMYSKLRSNNLKSHS